MALWEILPSTTNFLHNSVNLTNYYYPGGGGLYIEFPYCAPDNPEACASGTPAIPAEYTSNAHYVINNSTFAYNEAFMKHPIEYTYLLPQDLNHLAFGRGGGLSIYFSKIKDSTVVVDSCTFARNQAVWGGGVFVEFQDSSRNNSFIMSSSIVKGNDCKYNGSYSEASGGGGARFGYVFRNTILTNCKYNKILVLDCQFIGNKAYWGGGISFYAAREPSVLVNESTNLLNFTHCTWEQNLGRVGSALEVSVWNLPSEGAPVNPILTDCSFLYNRDLFLKPVGKLVGKGAVYVDSMPVFFNEWARFEGNKNSALVVVETMVDFLDNCVATFTNNSGRNGGAISLFGYAYIRVYENTQMNFVNNMASQYGGAIHSYTNGEQGLISFGSCFIQYRHPSVEPWKWSAQFYFEGNTAVYNGGNNSISAISLLPCLWGSYGPSEGKLWKNSITDIFCWGKNWIYVGRNCTDDISSAPAYFSQNVSVPIVEAIPGKPALIPLKMNDDHGNDVTNKMVLNAWSYSKDVMVANSSVYISDNTIEILGKPNSSATIAIHTMDPRTLYTELHVIVLPCPPGFIPRDRENLTNSCICAGTYSGIVVCHSAENRAYLQRGHWMGYYNKSKTDPDAVVVGMCAYTSSTMEEEYVPLPNKSSLLDSSLCAPIGRTGVLCGNCLQGYGPAVNSRYFRCVKCTPEHEKYNWAFYLVSKVIPITIFFFLVVTFQVSITSGPANAFIFFAQVLTTTFDIDGDGTTPLHNITSAASALQAIYTIPYDIWNLDFFEPVLPSYCLSSHIDTLGFIALTYVIAVYPLLLILLFYIVVSLYDCGVRPVLCLCRPIHRCFAKLRRKWNIQRSIIDAFATFLILSYTKLTVISVYLMTPELLFNNQGGTVAKVMYYNGNVDFLGKQHIFYFLLALTIMVFFVLLPPLLLLLYPLKATQRLAAWVGCNRLTIVQTGGRVQMFMDTFQGCYRDGTDGSRDCRFFAGIYFLLRTVLFTLYAYTGMWFRQYVVQQLVCTVGILLFSVIRPYKNNFYNNLDAVILGILAAINALSIYSSFQTAMNLPLSPSVFAVQYILIFLPLVYISAYIIWHTWNIKGKLIPCIAKLLITICSCLGSDMERRLRLNPVLGDDNSERTSLSSVDVDYLEFNRTVGECGRDREPNRYRPPPVRHASSVSSGEAAQHIVCGTETAGSDSETVSLIKDTGEGNSDAILKASGYGATGKN